MVAATSEGMTRITLSFMLSMLSDNYQGPDAPVNSKYHWAYKGPEGPENWHLHYKYCAGERQSPINILSSNSEYDHTLDPFILDHFDYASGPTGPCILNVTNNGHAATVRVIDEEMHVRGGGLGQTYKTAEFHFHWGSTDDIGSEHSVDGRKYPLEMHVVSFAEKYGTIREAMTKPDGLAVLGVFFELSEKDNPNFSALDETFRQVNKAGDHMLVNQLRLRSLLPDDLSKFWRYNGSLTTPFCFESVVWTVFSDTQKISKSQLETLRMLQHEDGHDLNDRGEHRPGYPSRITENWRPLMPLNGRVVKRSFGQPPAESPYKIVPDAKRRPEDARIFVSSNIYKAATDVSADSPNIDSATHTDQRGPQPSKNPDMSNSQRPYLNPMNNQAALPSSHLAPQNAQSTDKYFISNFGSQSSVNTSRLASNTASHRDSSINMALPQNGGASSSLFSQLQNSGDLEAGSAQPPPNLGQSLTSVIGNFANQNTKVNEGSINARSLTSAASEIQRTAEPQRGQSVSQEGTGDLSRQTSASGVLYPQFPGRTEESSSPHPQPGQNWAAVRERHQQHPSYHAGQNDPQHLQGPGPQQRQPQASTRPAVSVGQIENNLKEFVNNMILRRQHSIPPQHSPPFGSFPSMPPVVRQEQRFQQGHTYSASPQQHGSALPAHRPPSPQQLREIFQKLAASRRVPSQAGAITSGSRVITSGAATIPRLNVNEGNFRGDPVRLPDRYHSEMLMDGSSNGQRTFIHKRQGSNPSQYYSSGSSRDLTLNSQPRSYTSFGRPYSTRHQQDTSSYISPNFGFSRSYLESDPSVLGTPRDSIYDQGFPTANERPRVFIQTLNQPVRIQRPPLEQNQWRRRQLYW